MPHTVELPKQADVTRSRLPSLTGMRFIAAVGVFLFHGILYGGFFSSTHAVGVLGSVVNAAGWAGVVFFFILSGFVLTWSLRPKDTVPSFWRRRLLKVFPNHLVTSIIAFVLLAVVAHTAFTGKNLLNIFLLQAWVPNLATVFSGNVVSWSLSCELLFYLSFPLLYMGIRRIRPERLWAWAIGVMVAVGLVPTLASAIPPAQALSSPAVMPVIDVTMWQQWFVAFFPPVRMLEFVLGMILARVVITGRRLPLTRGGAVGLAVLGYALTPLFPGAYRIVATMVLPLALLIAASGKADSEHQKTWLASRVMVYLGDISFAFYVCHWLILDYGHQIVGATRSFGTAAALGVLALLLVSVVIVASALFLGVERPIMRRFANPKRRRATLTTVPEIPAAPTTPDTGGDRLAG
jgi:peptidoglycan/LPS O-acetylase OafA/YrhL